MKRTILLSLAAVLCISTSAQSGVIKTRNANPSDGKDLSMKEAILPSETRIKDRYFSWTESGDRLVYIERADTNIYELSVKDILKGNIQGSVYTANPYKENLPENAANVTPSPDKSNNAFTIANGLYFCDRNGNKYTIAESTDKNISYGTFTSRNEFGTTEGIFWAPSGKRLAFYRKDETAVTSFPLLDINTRTGSLFEIKYPMAGMASENVRVGIYDMASNSTVYVQADDFGYDQYLTNISWSPDDRYLLIQVLDRSQKHCRLNLYDSRTGAFIKTILTEDNEKWIEPQNPVWFVKGSAQSFIYKTDNRDGFKNLYLCDIDGNIRRLTSVAADVEYVGNNGKEVFYTSAEVSPVENHLFKVDIKTGKRTRLTFEDGWHNIMPNIECTYFIDRYSNLTTPSVTCLKSADGKSSVTLFEAADPVSYTHLTLPTNSRV